MINREKPASGDQPIGRIMIPNKSLSDSTILHGLIAQIDLEGFAKKAIAIMECPLSAQIDFEPTQSAVTHIGTVTVRLTLSAHQDSVDHTAFDYKISGHCAKQGREIARQIEPENAQNSLFHSPAFSAVANHFLALSSGQNTNKRAV